MKTSKCGLAYQTAGSDDTDFGIVLVHGWGCLHSDYDLVLQHLQNEKGTNYRIVTLDLPGHGETASDVLPKPSMTGFAELVLKLCQELGLQRVALAGHSMGVRVAVEAWRLSLNASPFNPSVVGLILIDGSYYKLRPSLFAFDNGDPRSTHLTEAQKAALKAEAFNKMFSPLTPQSFKDSTLSNIAAMDKEYSQDVRDSMIAYDRKNMEKTIQLLGKEGKPPVLNLQSSDIGPDNQRIAMQQGGKSKWMMFLEDNVPRIQQIVITDSAHFSHVDRPDVVARAIHEFMGEARP